MDPRLLRAYNEELVYLRESAREFGEERDVLRESAGQDLRALGDDADRGPELLEVEVADVDAADQ